ncbi:hypothetical protein HD553DRAFT_333425 [Filobasidium floriforme]|uniref:uncharacterized protein n=1 Tax=Filobasidium floriforme TaxID=5210 RepID=UPI001E8D24C9|nr:uncharacterized protein HD553DRAFT_333425 [Filobasidium floriforme]KAH8089536.1 hypothetical protein HD553DRAFT_333425 [Filobasidium floriforme]
MTLHRSTSLDHRPYRLPKVAVPVQIALSFASEALRISRARSARLGDKGTHRRSFGRQTEPRWRHVPRATVAGCSSLGSLANSKQLEITKLQSHARPATQSVVYRMLQAAPTEQQSQRAANSNPYRPSLFVCSAGTVSDYQSLIAHPLDHPSNIPGDPALPPLPPCNFSGSSFKIFFESADLTIRTPTSLSPPFLDMAAAAMVPTKNSTPPTSILPLCPRRLIGSVSGRDQTGLRSGAEARLIAIKLADGRRLRPATYSGYSKNIEQIIRYRGSGLARLSNLDQSIEILWLSGSPAFQQCKRISNNFATLNYDPQVAGSDGIWTYHQLETSFLPMARADERHSCCSKY